MMLYKDFLPQNPPVEMGIAFDKVFLNRTKRYFGWFSKFAKLEGGSQCCGYGCQIWWTGNGPNDPSRVRHGIVEYMSVGSGFRMPCSTSMFLIRLHDPRLFSKTRSTSLGDQLDLSLMPL